MSFKKNSNIYCFLNIFICELHKYKRKCSKIRKKAE